ncbi:MAG: hypothetical protein QOE36_22 [Gaiellaceae bacterium]|jgi:hypothetical protein|nr:hypothetical protein [Gaiellaceae bacterium]
MSAHVKTAIIAALVGAVAASATGAIAGSGIGAVFNLGQSNTVNAPSGLSGTTAGNQLVVANLGTASSSSALLAYGKGASPAATFQNGGAGPALSLLAGAGKPPFTTNSAYRVANLNADKLDGLDASAFTQGVGTQNLAKRVVMSESETNVVRLFSIPGLGTFTAVCLPSTAERGPGPGVVSWTNDTGGNVDLWFDIGPNYDFQGEVAPPGRVKEVVGGYRDGVQYGSTVALGHGGDIPGPLRSATVHIFVLKAVDGAPCGIQAQATVWTEP